MEKAFIKAQDERLILLIQKFEKCYIGSSKEFVDVLYQKKPF